MTGKDAETSERITDGKARENKEVIESEIAKSFEKNQPTDEFRQTLLKSGLDVSEFHVDEAKPAPISADNSLKSDAVYSAKSRNEFLEAGLIQSSVAPPKSGGKIWSRFGRWQHLTAMAGILAIIILQSAFQFSFIQDEKLRVAENVVNSDLPTAPVLEKPSNAPPVSEVSVPEIKEEAKVETKTAYKNSLAEISTQPKKAAPKVQREVRISVPRPALRKKEMRESNAERLRRAEKILTGI